MRSEWLRSLTLKTGKLDLQRKLINAAFDRSEQGRLIRSLSKPILESLKSTWTQETATTAEKSLPKTLFCGKFNLTPEMFEEGLRNDEFVAVTDAKGRLTDAWRSNIQKFQVGEKQGSSYKAEVKGAKGDAAAFDRISSNWKIGLFVKNAASGSQSVKGGGRGGQLAICDMASITP